MTLTFDFECQGPVFECGYMSKSTFCSNFFKSFMKLNLIYLSAVENNYFVLIYVIFKSPYYLSQSYHISSKPF